MNEWRFINTLLREINMHKILIKNGSLLSIDDGYHYKKQDILIKAGRIVAIEDTITSADAHQIDAQGLLISPGFIDVHTHVFPKGSLIGVDADKVGVYRGTTTVIDAGSAGPLTIEQFIDEVVKPHKTRVYSLLNVSKKGLVELNELDEYDKVDENLVYQALRKYPDTIVGLKARASSSVVGEQGIVPIQRACKIATDFDIPLMIHTGNFPPHIEEVLELMRNGDILTHAFHGKKGGLLGEQDQVIKEAVRARSRGVLFDVGHGSASFSFKTFARAKDLGFYPDMVSTDIHCQNVDDVVYSQHAVISKLINCGEDLGLMIQKATSIPANRFNLNEIGHLRPGYLADISISELISSDESVVDSMGNELHLKQKLIPKVTIVSKNNESEIIENEEGF